MLFVQIEIWITVGSHGSNESAFRLSVHFVYKDASCHTSCIRFTIPKKSKSSQR